ncbi:MAG: hypothetical protein LBU95_04975 [Rikenellaceae bacterium]|jgi:hypothetical protein|nr:hypothetical protein [Rikenellaceae bacterium]
MKKVITLGIVLLITTIAFAQNKVNADPSPHLAFKGVPIDGTLNEYVSKMKQQGFTHVGTEDGIAMLEGDFAAYKNCIVGVVTLKQKDLVSKITVIFPKNETWSSLSSNYFSLKGMLTEKYGEPSDCVEKFQSSYPPKDDKSKMHEVMMDRCKYYTIYETEKGNIELLIHGEVTNCFVHLSYFDKINGDLIRAKAMDDL